jgi:hypothetical protein
MAGGLGMVGALLLALVSAHYDVPRSSAAVQRLREHLLTGLDSFVPPDTDGTTGIQIGIQYRFFKVISVDLASGKLVTKIWRRMRWADHRLLWDPAEWDNVTQVVMYPGAHSGGAADALDNNMWTPQVVLYNGITPQDQVMEEGAAWVTHTGAVWYSTPGVIDVSCRFAGLSSFPYDELTCPIEIASWSYSDLVTNLTYMEDRACVDLTTENPTAGTTYAEYQLSGYKCNTACGKCRLGSASARLLHTPQGAPGGSGRRGTPKERSGHWPPSHRLACSSQPPPKSPIPLVPSTI